MGQGTSSSASVHHGTNTNRKHSSCSRTSNSSKLYHQWQQGDQEQDLTVHLPEECLASIFAKLSCDDRNACSLVCNRWNWIESKSRQRLVLIARSDLSHQLPDLLTRFENVSVLSLRCSRKFLSIDDKALCLIPKGFRSLKKLKLKGCVEITDDGLISFSLFFSGKVAGNGEPAPPLKKFSCASCSFGSKGINSLLSNCPQLQDLTLKRLRKLDSQNHPLVATSDNKLQRLCLKDLHNAQLFAPLLQTSQSLKTLILCRSSGNWDLVLDGATASHGGQEQNLRDLVEVQIENVQLGDTGLMAMSRCSNLEVLYVSRASDCTDVGFSAVASGCRKLRKVHVDGCKFNRIGDAGLLSIAGKCPLLQEIVLMGIPVTVITLDALASNCAFLERMALCNTDSVGDAELRFVAGKFSTLKKLCVKNCPVTDNGIEAIVSGCPNLVKLKVKRCRGITQTGIAWLMLQRSSLVVSVDTGSVVGAEEDEMVAVEGGEEAVVVGGRNLRTRSSSTHLVCGRRGNCILKTRIGNAASNLLLRRSSLPSSSSSSHADRSVNSLAMLAFLVEYRDVSYHFASPTLPSVQVM